MIRSGSSPVVDSLSGSPPWRLLGLIASLLILGLVILRWPGGLEFRSDDYLAIHYVQDWDRVLQDFVGPQYDMQRLALFYRPLITLSIAVDARLGGNESFVPLFVNLLVHMANTGLLYLLLGRFIGRMPALCAAGWWAWQSGHLEAISWMVGRVDTHSTLFYLLAIELDLRYRESRLKRLWPALLVFVLACMTKELSLTLPGALLLIWLLRASSDSWPTRLRTYLGQLLPYSLLLLLVLASRRLILGEEIGGYASAVPEFSSVLSFWRPFLPRGLAATPGLQGITVAILSIAAIIVLAWRVRHRLRAVPLLIVLTIVLSLPSAGARGDGGSERYDYLPSTALAGLLGLGGPLPPLLMLGADLFTSIPERQELRAVAAEVRHHRAEATKTMSAPQADIACFIDAPLAIDGRVAFNVGTDRLGLPPFGQSPIPVLPRRAIDPSLETQRRIFKRGQHLPDYRGPPRLDLAMLGELRTRSTKATIGLAQVRASRFGVLVAGSQGWLRVQVAADADGRLDVLDLLLSPLDGSSNKEALITHLWPSAETSVDPRPLIYLEAEDESGKIVARSSRGVFLPLGNDFGVGIIGLRKRTWMLVALLVFTVCLVPFWRSAKSNRGSMGLETDVSAEAN